MIVVRNVFRVRFGEAKKAIELWREGLELERRLGHLDEGRLLTDVVGPFYTLVIETEHESLAAWEAHEHAAMADDAVKEWYGRAKTVMEEGYREVLEVVSG